MEQEPVTFTIPVESVWPEVVTKIPKGKVSLYPHQIDCVKWMLMREQATNSGNILGDVMGLGKTMSTVTLLTH